MTIGVLDVSGSGTLRDGTDDFPKGTMSGTYVKNDNLSLARDDATAIEWIKMSNETIAEERDSSMVYDPSNREVLLFGGWSFGVPQNGTWAFNWTEKCWKKKSTKNSPSPRSGVHMVFDESERLVLLYGGEADSEGYMCYDETWSLDIPTGTWTALNISTDNIPNPAGLVYDTANAAVARFDDAKVRVFNWSMNSWDIVLPSTGPSGTGVSGISYDERNHVTVLFVGSKSYGLNTNDTWIYDLGTNKWTQMQPPVSPPHRDDVIMYYDDALGETIWYDPISKPSGVMWSYNLTENEWTNLTTGDTPWCYHPSACFDWEHGVSIYRINLTTRSFDSGTSNWSVLYEYDAPQSRLCQAMAYDTNLGVGLLFGGDRILNSETDGLWVFDPSLKNWEVRKTPPGLYDRDPAMAYNPQDDLTLIQDDTGTWIYFAQNDTWEMKGYDKNASFELLTYDLKNRLFVAYSTDATLTYNYSKNLWTQMNPVISPPKRTGAAMAYDSTAGAVVLFGGRAWQSDKMYDDTWTYDIQKNIWTDITPAARPQARNKHLLVDYPVGGGVLMTFGSTDINGWYQKNDTWIFNTTVRKWTQKATVAQPEYRDTAAGFYSSWDETVYVFGGRYRPPEGTYHGLYNFGDLWSFGPKRFCAWGTLTSRPFDTGGKACFGSIDAVCDPTANSTVRFQVRSADQQSQLDGRNFIGPDGTAKTYYKGVGEYLFGGHNGSRWVQYQAILSTSDTNETPFLRNVTIGYNLMHTVTLKSPRAEETWKDSVNISWNASDPDGNKLEFDIYAGNSTGSQLLVSDLVDGNRSWTWDLTTVYSGAYKIRIIARDDDTAIPIVANDTSATFMVSNPALDNRPPTVNLLEPADGSIVQTAAVNLSWESYDADDDILNYTVYLSDIPFSAPAMPGPLLRTAETCCSLADLADKTSYYWTVVAEDEWGKGHIPGTRSFSIDVPPPNRPPVVSLGAPANGLVTNSTEVELVWNASDPDGDAIVCSVFLADRPLDVRRLPPAITNTTLSSFRATGLVNGTAYHWTVVASDGALFGAPPEPRSFAIDWSIGNHPPVITSLPPANATVGMLLVYNATASDGDGDDFTFSLITNLSGASISSSGRFSWTPLPSQKGNRSVTIRVTDAKGGYSDQTFAISVDEIIIPPLKPVCTILSPANGTRVKGTIQISGTAARGDGPNLRVFVRVDGKRATNAVMDKNNWSYSFYSEEFEDGGHLIEAWANDDRLDSEIESMTVLVKNDAPPEPRAGTTQWIPVVAAVLVIACIAGFLLSRRQRKRPGP